MRLHEPPGPMNEQALDKFAAKQRLTRTPHLALSPASLDGRTPATVVRTPPPNTNTLSAPDMVSALKEPHTKGHDAGRT